MMSRAVVSFESYEPIRDHNRRVSSQDDMHDCSLQWGILECTECTRELSGLFSLNFSLTRNALCSIS